MIRISDPRDFFYCAMKFRLDSKKDFSSIMFSLNNINWDSVHHYNYGLNARGVIFI